MDSARNLAGGHGLELSAAYPYLEPTIQGRSPFPLVHWPPLYPTVVAGLSKAFGGELEAARWLMLLTLAANVALFARVLWRLTDGRRLATVLGTAALALSPVGLTLHIRALTEPLFILLALGSLELLAVHLTRGGRRWLVAAGAVMSAALLTRYAGLPLPLTGFVGLMAFGQGAIRPRLARAVAFATVVVVPLVAVLSHNASVAGTATGRGAVGWHLELLNATQGLGAASLWLGPDLEPLPRLLLATLAAAMLALGFRALLRRVPRAERMSREREVRLTLLLTFSVGYLLALGVSKAFFDAANPIDPRGLSVAYVGLALCAIAWVSEGLVRARRRAVAPAAAALALGAALVLGAYVQQSIVAARDLSRNQVGYGAQRWTQSTTIRDIRKLPTRTRIYSNAPEAIFLLTGRRAESVPVRVDPVTAEARPGYRAELERLRSRARRAPLVVAYFEQVKREYLPSGAEVAHSIGLRPLEHASDGTIYGPRGRAQLAQVRPTRRR